MKIYTELVNIYNIISRSIDSSVTVFINNIIENIINIFINDINNVVNITNNIVNSSKSLVLDIKCENNCENEKVII